MFQIGEFSRIARVTIETLRHYDTMGLLKPAKVDSKTGYRYYNAGQLQLLNQILALKDLGLSLEEISHIIKDKPTVDEFRGILKAQLVLAENTLEAEEKRRQRILARLQGLDSEEGIRKYEVSLKSVERLLVAAMREKIPGLEEIPQRWNTMFTSIAHWLKTERLPIGIPMAFYHDEAYRIENIDTECAFSIPNTEPDKLPKPAEGIFIRQVDAVPELASVVVTDFHIKVEGLKEAYAALGQWVADNNYRISAAPRELYYGSPETKDFTAEIQFPVVRLKSE